MATCRILCFCLLPSLNTTRTLILVPRCEVKTTFAKTNFANTKFAKTKNAEANFTKNTLCYQGVSFSGEKKAPAGVGQGFPRFVISEVWQGFERFFLKTGLSWLRLG